MKKRSLYEVVVSTFREISNSKIIPKGLKFRLININARNLDYDEFKYYYDLKNEYETLKFLLNDMNLEEITRYSLAYCRDESPIWVDSSFAKDALKEHLMIDYSLCEEEMGYQK